MHISYISIFPDIYTSFLSTTLIHKAQEKGLLHIKTLDPRTFCADKHHTIDDEIYGGGAGLLMKGQPMIDAVESLLEKHALTAQSSRRVVIFVSPSAVIFDQTIAYHAASAYDHIIFISGRYEGIDYRFEQYMHEHYPHHFQKISVGVFVTL
jgi:tRNA (guanine37-N1)-methyltransferase